MRLGSKLRPGPEQIMSGPSFLYGDPIEEAAGHFRSVTFVVCAPLGVFNLRK